MAAKSTIAGALVLIAFSAVLLILFQTAPVDSGEQLPRSHSEIDCNTCHVATASTGPATAGFAFNDRCRDCHGTNPSQVNSLSLNFHTTTAKQCTECHSFHSPRRIVAMATEFSVSYESNRMRGHCYACHAPGQALSGLSPGHRQATAIFHRDFQYLSGLTVSEACLVCHGEGNRARGKLKGLAEGASVPSFDPHGSHPVGVELKPGAGKKGNRIKKKVDPRLQLVGGRVECISCHSLSARTSHRLVEFESPHELCRACHDVG